MKTLQNQLGITAIEEEHKKRSVEDAKQNAIKRAIEDAYQNAKQEALEMSTELAEYEALRRIGEETIRRALEKQKASKKAQEHAKIEMRRRLREESRYKAMQRAATECRLKKRAVRIQNASKKAMPMPAENVLINNNGKKEKSRAAAIDIEDLNNAK